MKNNSRNIRSILKNIIAINLVVMLTIGCKKDEVLQEVTLITATGDINIKVNEFRQLLGSQLNINPGAVGGRREINWDGVPADLLDKPLAVDFFNTPGNNIPAARQKGLVYSSGVANFQVSNDGFKNANTAAATSFTAFSGSQTFANLGSNLWDIGFQIPGENLPATVKGFGLVFSDVDVANSTFIEFFNGTKSVGKFFAPVHDANSSFSFVGAYFNKETITHVRVGHDGTLGGGGNDISEGGQKDLVVFDDFLFNEPVKH